MWWKLLVCVTLLPLLPDNSNAASKCFFTNVKVNRAGMLLSLEFREENTDNESRRITDGTKGNRPNSPTSITLNGLLQNNDPISSAYETKPRLIRKLIASYLHLIRWLVPDNRNELFIYEYVLGGFNSVVLNWLNSDMEPGNMAFFLSFVQFFVLYFVFHLYLHQMFSFTQ